jgi:Domain of unknown function (DUF397)
MNDARQQGEDGIMDTAKADKITLDEAERASLAWLKAQASTYNGQCVEIASTSGKVALRDSKDPDGPILVYTNAEFKAFLDGARNGEFDNLLQ